MTQSEEAKAVAYLREVVQRSPTVPGGEPVGLSMGAARWVVARIAKLEAELAQQQDFGCEDPCGACCGCDAAKAFHDV